MNEPVMRHAAPVWRETPMAWATLAVTVGLLFGVFHSGLTRMVEVWGESEEYGYGYAVPFIALFLLWQKKNAWEKAAMNGAWMGAFIVFVAVLLRVVGDLSTLYLVVQYSFLIALMGLLYALAGWRGFKIAGPPLLFLAFMIPLPQFLFRELSQSLQLISSTLGVALVKLFGISVFLEGNVIDLGNFQLQVVEACSGLRYLFPLLTLGFIMAYFYRDKFWKRVLVFLSAIPLTVLMNSLRIAAVGVTVEYWGKSMAEGVLHDFEGWAMFMSCIAVMVAEMWLLSRRGGVPFSRRFNVEMPLSSLTDAPVLLRGISKPFVVAAAILFATLLASIALPERQLIRPERMNFSAFPLEVGVWRGKEDRLQQVSLNALHLDDYIMADFFDGVRAPVNLYVAYYASQIKGESAHSPRTCIPGGGWAITDLEQRELKDIAVNVPSLQINRSVIQQGENRQLVYYWFQQRGRIVTNEYLVKWYIFWDALTRNRSDGSLVRLTANMRGTGDLEATDKLLQEFLRAAWPHLIKHMPD
ncbi:MAG: VPLPA-CTERM-specific exosortase XrtD [Pseudomonadota bacterium]